MSNLKAEMGLRIKNRRKEIGLTQESFAEKLEISVKHLSEVERGLAGLSIENLVKLSEILEISLDYVIKGKIDEDKWGGVSYSLKNVPTEKEKLIKELITLGIELTK